MNGRSQQANFQEFPRKDRRSNGSKIDEEVAKEQLRSRKSPTEKKYKWHDFVSTSNETSATRHDPHQKESRETFIAFPRGRPE